MKKLYNVPQNDDNVLAYLNYAVKEFVKRSCLSIPNYDNFIQGEKYYRTYQYQKNKDLHELIMSDLYNQGRNEGAIPWHFNKFKEYVNNGYGFAGYGTPVIYKYIGWNTQQPERPYYWRGFYRFQYPYEKTSYRRKPEHKKKELSKEEDAKQAWREHKYFNKDKSKRRCYRRTRWIKNIINRKERRKVKRQLNTGEYDEISTFRDPYNWWLFD